MSVKLVGTSSQYLAAGQVPVAVLPFSIGAWFKTSVSSWIGIVSVAKAAAAYYHALATQNWRGRARTYGGTLCEAYTTTTFASNTWVYVLGFWVFIGERTVLIDNGGESSNISSQSVADLDECKIGVTADSTPAGFFTGLIAEVGIWDRKLSNYEGQLLANGIRPNEAALSGLIAYYPLVDDYLDYIGSYDMTAYNSPVFDVHPTMRHKAQISNRSGLKIQGLLTSNPLRRTIL